MGFTIQTAAASFLLASSIVNAYATDSIIAGELAARDAALADLRLRSAAQWHGQRINFARQAAGLTTRDALAEAIPQEYELHRLVRKALVYW